VKSLGSLPMPTEKNIVLSVVVRIVGEGVHLHRCLSRLVPQIEDRAIEVIIPYDSTISSIDLLKKDFPQVICVDMGVVKSEGRAGTLGVMHELYDRRTATGLAVARGEVLALLEDYGAPDPDWCDQVLEAHQLPYGVIGGAVEHEGSGTLNWAVYFLDFGRYQLPLDEGPAHYLTDVNVSYKRAALESVRELWKEQYNEVTVNWALARQGTVLWQRPQIVVREDRGKLSFLHLLVERFWWGRLFGCKRAQELSSFSRLLYIILSPAIPFVLLGRISGKVFRGRRNRAQFLLSFPQIVMMTLCWCLGEWVGYVTGRAFSR
jgi:hypothetical protein